MGPTVSILMIKKTSYVYNYFLELSPWRIEVLGNLKFQAPNSNETPNINLQ